MRTFWKFFGERVQQDHILSPGTEELLLFSRGWSPYTVSELHAIIFAAGDSEGWVISYSCRIQVDGAEHMVACDSCEIWLHTCAQDMPDAEPIFNDLVG